MKEITSLPLFPELNWCWHGAKVSRAVGYPSWSRWTWVFKNIGGLRGVSMTCQKNYFTDLCICSGLEPQSRCTSFLDTDEVFVDLFWRWPEQDLPWFLEDFSSAWKSLANKCLCVWRCEFQHTGSIRANYAGTWWGRGMDLLEVPYGCEWGETWMSSFLRR